jgi:hypothetical protein
MTGQIAAQAKLECLVGYDGWLRPKIYTKEKVNQVETNCQASTGDCLHDKCLSGSTVTFHQI